MVVAYARISGAWVPTSSPPPIDPTPAWTALPLASGWTSIAGWGTPAYRKIGDEVALRGLVANPNSLTGGAGGTTYTIATLPVGFLPAGRSLFAGQGGTTSSSTAYRVDVHNTTGAITIVIYATVTLAFLALDGIRFSVTP